MISHARPDDEAPLVAVMYLGSNGGGPKFAYELARGLQRAGNRILPIVSDHVDNRPDFDSLGPVLAPPTFRTSLGAAVRSPLIVINAMRIVRQFRRRRFAAVVVAMEHVWQAPILAAMRFTGVPQLLCVHDAAMHPGDANRLEATLLKWQRRVADGALAFSDHVATRLVTDGSFAKDRIWQTVHGAFGRSAESPHQPPVDRPPVVGFFGRIAEYKGIDLCYAAVQLLRDGGQRVIFRVVGDGAIELVAGYDHEDDDIRPGWVDDADIPQILEGFDILVLPYREASQSGVFAYAISQGLPIVATPVGGLRQQAEQTGAAALSRTSDATGLCEAIRSVIDDKGRYRQLGANGMAAARGSYSWDRVAGDAQTAIHALSRGDKG